MPATLDRAGPGLGVGLRDEYLAGLMEQISRGDRTAFAALYDHTSGPVHAQLAGQQNRERTTAILAATYVEVWWLAGCRTPEQHDVVAWINQIVRRRAAPMPNERAPIRPAGHAVRELAGLLDRSPETLDRPD